MCRRHPRIRIYKIRLARGPPPDPGRKFWALRVASSKWRVLCLLGFLPLPHKARFDEPNGAEPSAAAEAEPLLKELEPPLPAVVGGGGGARAHCTSCFARRREGAC